MIIIESEIRCVCATLPVSTTVLTVIKLADCNFPC
jgi:hypothetical protein